MIENSAAWASATTDGGSASTAELVKQAEDIKERVQLAKIIATAEYGFKPIQLRSYHLYKKGDRFILTLIAPNEWSSPYHEYVAKVRQLGDSTWENITEKKEKQ